MAKKPIRSRLGCTYCMAGENGGDMTAYASKGTYLRKNEQFRLGIYVFECRQRFKTGRLWQFECFEVRKLTRDEFVNKNWPPEVPGVSW